MKTHSDKRNSQIIKNKSHDNLYPVIYNLQSSFTETKRLTH